MKRFWGYFSVSISKFFAVKRLWLQVGVALVILSLLLPVISIRPVRAQGSASPTPDTRPTTWVEYIRTDEPSPTNQSTVTWTVWFNDQITGLDVDNFTLTGNGLGDTPNILNVSSILPDGPGGSRDWTVTVDTGNGSGTLGLNLINDNHLSRNITNIPFDGQDYSVDREFPYIESFIRKFPEQQITKENELIFQVLFHELMDESTVDEFDFSIHNNGVGLPTTNAEITKVQQDNDLKRKFYITVKNGDLENFNGDVGLDIHPNSNLTDKAGNQLLRDEPQIDQFYTLDNTPPHVTNVTSTDGTYHTNDPVYIKISFGEPIQLDGHQNSKPKLTLQIGSPLPRTVDCDADADSSSLLCTYIVNNGETTSNQPLDYVDDHSLNLNGNTIKDGLGNPASSILLPPPHITGSLSDNNTIYINATEPMVTNITASPHDESTPLNIYGHYNAGAVIDLAVTFNKSVSVENPTTLVLNTIPIRVATYDRSNEDSTILFFTYTVQPNDTTPVFSYLKYVLNSGSKNPLSSGSIKGVDSPYSDAVWPMPEPWGTDIVIDTSSPTVASISSSKANGSYNAGVDIPLTVEFSEAVTVTGTPQITLDIVRTGPNSAVASCAALTNNSKMTCIYIVLADDNSPDLNYVSVGSLTLTNGSTITDLAGNPATLVLPDPASRPISWGGNQPLIIDTIAPGLPLFDFSTTNLSFNHETGLVGNFTKYKRPVLRGTVEAGSSVKVDIYLLVDDELVLPPKINVPIFTALSGDWSYSPPTSSLELPDALYRVMVTATDNAQNSSVTASADFTVDTTNPVTIFDAAQLQYPLPRKDTDFIFKSTDANPFTFICDIDGSGGDDYKDCTSTLANLENGTYKLQVRAKDKAGNLGDPQPSTPGLWNLIKPPPVKWSKFPSNPTFVEDEKNNTQVFYFKGEAGSTFQCTKIDIFVFTDGETCSSPQPYFNVRFGSHNVWIRATVGGVIGDPKEVTWVVDNTKINSHPDPITSSTQAKFTFWTYYSELNKKYNLDIKYKCRLDKSDEQGFTDCSDGTMSYPNITIGTHTFDVIAIKTNGTRSDGTQGEIRDLTPASYTWTVAKERIANNGFNLYVGTSKTPTKWVKSATFTSLDGKDTLFKQEGLASVKIFGNGKIKTLTQTLNITGLSGTKVNFSFYAKGNAIPALDVSKCKAEITLYRSVGTPFTKTVQCTNGTYGFTKKTVEFSAPWAFNKVVIKFTFAKPSGVIWFDLVSLLFG